MHAQAMQTMLMRPLDFQRDGWDIRCWKLDPGLICDPNDDTGQLQHCPFTGTNPCDVNNPDWPTLADVKKAVQMSSCLLYTSDAADE